LSDCGQLPKLFKEAVQYVLPKALMEPIYHFFYYCNIMQHMSKATEDEDDHIAFESAISGTLAHKLQVERESQRFLPRRREDVGVFGRRVGYRYSMKKLIDLQARIEGWDGPDIHMCCTELVKEGPVSIAREGGRKAMKQKMERHVILLDGLVLCCKIKKAATPVAPAEYRLKEKIVIKGHVNLIDIEETDDLKFAFELREEDSGSPGIIFILQSPPEKNEWMSAITILLIRSTFDKALEKKLKQEEKLIPVLLPDPEKYKFAEPNSEDNILFEEEQGDGQVLIKAGTIYKLVERLTFNEYADPTFVRTFLMTYRSFCKPVELIDLLIERYYIPPPSYSDDYESRKDPHKREALKRFKVDYVSPVQLRVLNVLRHWVENHYYDFQQEPEVLDKLKEFVGTVKAKNMQKLVASIHRTLNKKEGRDTGGPPSTSDPVFFDPPPQTEWHLTRNKDEFHILTLHPLEFARQLTLVMSDLFKAIRSSELVDASWTKEHKKENSSPNLLRMSRYETKLTNWIRHTIVFTENFEERVALCSRLVDIMEELIGLNNFAALFAFNAAFQSSQVFRLKSTMKELTPKRKQILEEISHVASTDKGYKHYRERLRSINPPCVLFVGMYLTWIVFIKDGNEGKVRGKPENFINFKKRRMIANILQEIQQYQNTPYCLKAEGSIQEYLQSHDVRGEMGDNQFEDYLYDQSVEIEPRDQPYKKAPRKHRFELRPPNTQPGALAHFLEVATIRRGPSDRKKQMSADEVSISSASGIEGSQSSHSLAESDSNLEKESDGKEKRKEEKEIDGPPPIPPKATHITTVGGVEVTSVATPPKLPPRSASPRLETLPDTFVTLSRPPKPHPPKAHRAPPEIPTETREEPPPRPPRIRDASPVTPSTPDNDAGMIPPPIPPHPRRSYSPSSSLNNYSPHSSPLPHPHSLPPPRPPPPRVGLSTDGMLGNNKETTPPAIPPRPLSHVAPPLPLSNNQAPPIPPKPIR
jgi:son of sevenless-like protein